MIWEFAAIVIMGVAAVGVVVGINRMTGRWMPKWAAPAAAGLAMLATTIYSEYTWMSATRVNLPEGAEIVSTFDDSQAYRPWTYVWPVTTRFLAVTNMRDVEGTDFRSGIIIAVSRWQPGRTAFAVYDCDGNRAVHFGEGMPEDIAAAVELAGWTPVTGDDPVRDAICK